MGTMYQNKQGQQVDLNQGAPPPPPLNPEEDSRVAIAGMYAAQKAADLKDGVLLFSAWSAKNLVLFERSIAQYRIN